MHFAELCPFFKLEFLSSIKHPTTERWHQHAVLLFQNVIWKLIWVSQHFVNGSKIKERHESVH